MVTVARKQAILTLRKTWKMPDNDSMPVDE